MRSLFIAIITVFLAVPAGAEPEAQEPVLVELFTSQGCLACPAADAFLEELAARDDVIALALHVDYWDYIYDDIFGKAAHTERQYGYADAGGRRILYTPQMIIDGSDDAVGNRTQDVNALIERHLAAPRQVSLTVRREAGRIVIAAHAREAVKGPLLVEVAHFIPHKNAAIEHGDNAGKIYSYTNIVTDLREVGRWNPVQPLQMHVKVQQNAPVVVILQHPDYGPVEAVAMLR